MALEISEALSKSFRMKDRLAGAQLIKDCSQLGIHIREKELVRHTQILRRRLRNVYRDPGHWFRLISAHLPAAAISIIYGPDGGTGEDGYGSQFVTSCLTHSRYLFSLGMSETCLMVPSIDTSRDLFPGALEMMILESLRRQPAHGYALVQHIQQRSQNLLQVEEGSLYPALQRLLKSKMVKAEWAISSSTNRRVRVYQITKAGLRHLEKEISSFDRMLEGIQMVLGSPRRATNT